MGDEFNPVCYTVEDSPPHDPDMCSPCRAADGNRCYIVVTKTETGAARKSNVESNLKPVQLLPAPTLKKPSPRGIPGAPPSSLVSVSRFESAHFEGRICACSSKNTGRQSYLGDHSVSMMTNM